jgi:hypothetical protein
MDATAVALIASSAVNALVPFFNKGLDKIVDKSAEEVFNKRSEIWGKVKGLFAEDELTTLDLFEANPEDAKTQGKLEGKLEEKLKTNPETFNQLDTLIKHLEEMEKHQPAPKNVSNIKNENVHNSFIVNDVKQS